MCVFVSRTWWKNNKNLWNYRSKLMIYNDTTRICYISHLIAWQRNIVSVCALPKKKVWVNEMSWQTVLAAINGHNSVVRSDEELSKRHGIHLKWIRSNELVTVFSAVFKQINEANWNWNGMEWNQMILCFSFPLCNILI